MKYRIGIDVGGTFTDVVGVDAAGKVTFTKAATTPADPSMGVMEGLTLLAAALDFVNDGGLELDLEDAPEPGRIVFTYKKSSKAPH